MNENNHLDIDVFNLQQTILSHLQKHWRFFYAEGIFFIILGMIAFIVPHVFSIGITLFLGWVLLIAGIVQVTRSVRLINMPGFMPWLFIGLLQIITGYLLLMVPAQGVITLTMLLTLFFAMEGVAKIFLAFMMRPIHLWDRVCFSGVVSLFLALVIWTGMPGAAFWGLGFLFGINMIFLGWTLITFSSHHKA